MSETIDPAERLLFDEDFAPAKATEPNKAWRNRYFIGCPDGVTFEDERDLEGHQPPGECIGRLVWPSRDVAEAVGRRLQELPWVGQIQYPDHYFQHLGAFPVEGEAP